MIDWSHVYYKRYIPPYIPPIDPSNASDTQNFDETFLDMEPVIHDADDEEAEDGRETDHGTDGSRTEDEKDGVAEENRTPSQSRRNSSAGSKPKPVQAVEEDDESVDAFDGYSFKGRHSVLIDDEEDSGSDGSSDGSDRISEDSHAKDQEIRDHLQQATDRLAEQLGVTPELAEEQEAEEEEDEPKTPPARPLSLPQEITEEKRDESDQVPPTPPPPTTKPAHKKTPSEPVDAGDEPKTRKSKDFPRPVSIAPVVAPVVPVKDKSAKPTALPTSRHPAHKRKEKSGVAALDQYLSPDDGERTEVDEEDDDDWDLIDASNIEGEDKNGGRGNTLFARGVVDKYKLAVSGFGRKGISSTPSRGGARSVSGATTSTITDSPPPSVPSTPGSAKKRGKNQGYSFRKNPRQFLRPKSPPSSFSSATTNSPRGKAASSPGSTPSLTASGTLDGSTGQDSSMPSLKTKASGLSARSSGGILSDSELSASPETERVKGKKLKRVKENAEKVFSIFSSPRPHAASLGGPVRE